MAGAAPESGGRQPTAVKASSDVFISYASQDKPVADAACEALERAGIACWIAPRDVVPGEFYAGAIVHAIDATKAIVLILSQSAATSQHVLREVERASSKRRSVITFRIDLSPMPADLEYFLNTSHWLDASTLGVERALPKLVEAVRRLFAAGSGVELARSSGSPASAGPPVARASGGTTVPPRPSRTIIALVVVIALGFSYVVIDKVWRSKRVTDQAPVAAAAPATPTGASAIPEKSVAVLPFVDMSEKKDQEYFADGVAEELLGALVKVPSLKVIGRTSSFQFKGRNEDLRTIGSRLGVDYLVEGSVRRAGPRVRVTAQLIDARTAAHRWGESYDRDLTDILALQDQIAASIARALELAMTTMPERQRLNAEAYTLYLQGRSAYDRGGSGWDDARDYFQHALALDPSFSEAAEGLVLACWAMVIDSHVPGNVGWTRLREAADTTLRLNPKSAIAHVALGSLRAAFEHDWAAANEELDRALAIHSRDPVALYGAGWLAFGLGRHDEAAQLVDASLSLDPLNPDGYQALATIRFELGDFGAAEQAFRKSLEISPTFPDDHFCLGEILLLRGDAAAALKEMEAELPIGGRDAGLALAYYALGRKKDSDAALNRLIRERGELWPLGVAWVYAYRSDRDRAFEWLDRAYATRSQGLAMTIKTEPMLAGLRGDPRYNAFLRKMNLPE